MITVREIEMLASILLRAGVNQVEAAWCNSILDRLRAEAAAAELESRRETPDARDE